MRRIGIVFGMLALVGTLRATDTRVWTLTQGSVGFLPDDEVNVQFFPAQMFEFGSFVTIERPIVPGGSIIGIYGYASAFYVSDQFGLGLYLGRPFDLNMNIANISVAPVNMVFGVKSGSNAFALNLALNKYGFTSYDTNYKESATVFSFRPGFALDLGGGALDGSFHITYANGAVGDTSGSSFMEKLSEFSLGVTFRYRGPVIVPFELAYSRSSDTLLANPKSKNSTIFVGTGVGNKVALNDRISIVAYGDVGFINFSSSDTTGNKSLYLGTVIGGEFNVWRGLILRGSLGYNILNFNSFNDNFRSSYFSFGDFGFFTLGAGYDLGFARVDVALSTDLLTNGPYFLTGNTGSSIITMLSILGKF